MYIYNIIIHNIYMYITAFAARRRLVMIHWCQNMSSWHSGWNWGAAWKLSSSGNRNKRGSKRRDAQCSILRVVPTDCAIQSWCFCRDWAHTATKGDGLQDTSRRNPQNAPAYIQQVWRIEQFLKLWAASENSRSMSINFTCNNKIEWKGRDGKGGREGERECKWVCVAGCRVLLFFFSAFTTICLLDHERVCQFSCA